MSQDNGATPPRDELSRLDKNAGNTPPPNESDEYSLGHSATTDGAAAPVVLGNYVLLGKLGEGGMGTVYKARHQRMERTVALKVLSGSSGDHTALRRFHREVIAAASLVHPNIVTAYDAGDDKGVDFLVLEHVAGETLSQIVQREGKLSVADACEVIRQAAIGLHHAHQHGLVHRDVKPSNLMLSGDAVVKLLDLGLARFQTFDDPDQDEITATGQVMGTVNYMSPEQAEGRPDVDTRTDIFSLGATAFKLLSGSAPLTAIQAESGASKLTALILGRLPSLADECPSLPEELVEIVDRMLATEPSDRFQNLGDVATAIEPFCDGNNLSAVVRVPVEPLPASLDFNATMTLLNRDVSTSRAVRKEFPPTAAENWLPQGWSGLLRHWVPTVIFSALGLIVIAVITALLQRRPPAPNDEDSGGRPGEQVAVDPFAANIAALANLPPVPAPKMATAKATWAPSAGKRLCRIVIIFRRMRRRPSAQTIVGSPLPAKTVSQSGTRQPGSWTA